MSFNPFLPDDFDETCKDSGESLTDGDNSTERISYDTIAKQLLTDGLILSALELHTELQELGKPLPYLRDYFSNPGNFERTKQSDLSSTSPSVGLRKHGFNLYCVNALHGGMWIYS